MKWLLALLLAAGCAQAAEPAPELAPPPGWRAAWVAAAPRSILVLPPVNHSVNVEAPDMALASLTVPLAEKGYYVFPVRTVNMALEQEGWRDAGRLRALPPGRLAGLFGADLVLYVDVEYCDTLYIVVESFVAVRLHYKLVDRNGNVVWASTQLAKYRPRHDTEGDFLGELIGSAIDAAIARRWPDYMRLMREASEKAFAISEDALPDGPYRRQAMLYSGAPHPSKGNP